MKGIVLKVRWVENNFLIKRNLKIVRLRYLSINPRDLVICRQRCNQLRNADCESNGCGFESGGDGTKKCLFFYGKKLPAFRFEPATFGSFFLLPKLLILGPGRNREVIGRIDWKIFLWNHLKRRKDKLIGYNPRYLGRDSEKKELCRSA